MDNTFSFRPGRLDFAVSRNAADHGPQPFTPDHIPAQIHFCRCGAAWALTRIPTPHLIVEHLDCLCGAALTHWAEHADYVFEPVASDSPLPH